MKNLIILLTMLAYLGNAQASEQCFYGLYNQDTMELIIESDSSEYLESIASDYEQATTIEISYCL